MANKTIVELGAVLRMSVPERKPTDTTISFSQYAIYQACPLRWKIIFYFWTKRKNNCPTPICSASSVNSMKYSN